MCHISASQIAADGQVVANALTEISNQPDVPANVKSALVSAAAGLVQVTSNWVTGSAMSIFDDAMKAVTTALSLIPVTAPYAIFVGIAQTAIDLLWANFNVVTSPTPLTPSLAKAVTARVESIAVETPSPWHGKAVIEHHHFQSYRDAIAHTWNEAVTANPGMSFTKL
jgi:hypothetical protein